MSTLCPLIAVATKIGRDFCIASYKLALCRQPVFRYEILSTEMQQNRAGVNLGCKKSLFCQLWEDVSDLYTSAADTYLPACNLVCCSCRCRTCSTTISCLISAAVTVSYLRQNSRLLDDNGGLVVGSQFCSVAKMCGSNRIRQSGLPLTNLVHHALACSSKLLD